MISTYEPVSKKIGHYSANACLLPICSLHGIAVTTVEGIGCTKTRIHPVQERLAKCHGSQCGFCTPGMVMSVYALLRNHPEPSMEQIASALAGTFLFQLTSMGFRFIPCNSFFFIKNELSKKLVCLFVCLLKTPIKLFSADEFQPLDTTQEFIFPPELMRMAENEPKRTLVFHGERTTWISPTSLKELLELKAKYPKAPLVVGNTSVGPDMKFKGVYHPVIISPARILDLNVVRYMDNGLTLGAACSLALVKDVLTNAVSELPWEKTKIFRALLQQLKTLGGQQIRNIASLGGNIISRKSTSDLNPILAVGNCILNLASRGKRQDPCKKAALPGMPSKCYISVHEEFVSAFRQAQRRENSLPIANTGMRVLFAEDTDIIMDFGIFYGGIGSTSICAKQTCQALIGRHWNEKMLDEACRLVLKEVSLTGSAPGGKVEYRRTLMISFLFKFYLEVLQSLKKMVNSCYLSIFMQSGKRTLWLFFLGLVAWMSFFTEQEVNPEQLPQDPVGRPIMHQAGIKHATGEALYCDDIRAVDEELFLAVVTSSRAHAKIVSIDTSEALRAPGVFDIVTTQDVPAKNEFYIFSDPEILFAKDKVNCVGQIICAVVADSEVHAKQAAAKVKIGYETLEPVILTIEVITSLILLEAIQHNSFFEPQRKLEQGNVDEAFETVDQILEGEIHIGGQEHFYMETQSVLVVPKREDKEMDVYVSTQHPAFIQEMVASCLGVPANRIMCHVKRVGGAFGGKVVNTGLLASVAAVAANKTGHAVRLILDRGDDMLITGGRHPVIGKYKVGFMNDGRILAADAKYYLNGGSTPDHSILVAEVILLKMDNAYKIPNLRCCSRVCKTNLPSNTAFRGFGFPQSGLITESWMTSIAAKSGLSPEKVREINMYKETEQTFYKQELDPENLVRCWKECIEKSAYYSRKIAVEEFNKQNYWKKKGIAIIPMKYPFGFNKRFLSQAAALVHIYTDGSVLLTHGGIEMGQGILLLFNHTIKIANIHLSFLSFSSIFPNLSFHQDACQTLLKRLEPIISKNPKGSWNDWVKEAFEQSINLSATGYFRGECSPKRESLIISMLYIFYNIKKVKVFIISHSQIEGAFVQGIGLYTMEELKYSPEGVLYTRGPAQYKIPAVCDIPEQFSISLLSSSQNSYAIYSSKGMGEAGLFLGCSVFFAIWDAVTAVRKERGLTEPFTLNSPLTPERIRMACADEFTEMVMRVFFWNTPL
uniref:Aldehyde oxidase 1 n=1 Tax=Pelusios castaneus TaxID=367368 RepID=A0A8C8T1F7_9SAUR